MRELPREDWSKLTENHREAMRALMLTGSVALDTSCPMSMKTAMHDMWRFGFARRNFNQVVRSVDYDITDLGRECASEILN